MIYAQFFHMSTGFVPGSIPPQFDDAHKRPIEACGDRAVVVIDARLSAANIASIARAECVKRGYVGYRIFEGESFARSSPISPYWPVPCKPDNSATSASHGA